MVALVLSALSPLHCHIDGCACPCSSHSCSKTTRCMPTLPQPKVCTRSQSLQAHATARCSLCLHWLRPPPQPAAHCEKAATAARQTSPEAPGWRKATAAGSARASNASPAAVGAGMERTWLAWARRARSGMPCSYATWQRMRMWHCWRPHGATWGLALRLPLCGLRRLCVRV